MNTKKYTRLASRKAAVNQKKVPNFRVSREHNSHTRKVCFMNQIKLTGKFYLVLVAWSGRKYPICLQFTAFQMSEPRYYLIIGCTNIKFRYDWIYNQANVNVEPPEGLRHGSSAGHRQSIDLDVHNTATRADAVPGLGVQAPSPTFLTLTMAPKSTEENQFQSPFGLQNWIWSCRRAFQG